MKLAILMTWTESERGWGCRPDGASLHLSQESLKKYIADYWAKEKERNPSGVTPHEYTRPDGENGRVCLVTDDLYEDIRMSEGGYRMWQGDYSSLCHEGKIVMSVETDQQAELLMAEHLAETSDGDYVGIVESNDWEGEVFGYYWKKSPEAVRVLSKLVARYKQAGDPSMRLEIVTQERLHELDDADGNGYRRRVSVYKDPDNWDAFAEVIAPEGEEISSDDLNPFYKGRGIPDELKMSTWRTK